VPLQFISEWSNTKKLASSILGADLNMTCPQQAYIVDPSLEMVIQGEFPRLRYFAFVAYDERNEPIATLRDEDIVPDPGSTNPYLPGSDWNTKERRYTITVRFSPPPATSSGGKHSGSHTAHGNFLYLGTTAAGGANSGGRLVYRRYLPSMGLDVDGGADEPIVYYRKVADGTFAKPPQAKASDLPDQDLRQFVPDPDIGPYTLDGVQWRRWAQGTRQQTSTETIYLTAGIKADPARLLLVRWKAPTFPDTCRNKGIKGGEQARYWSMSFATKDQLTTAFSLPDCQAAIGSDGYVNMVVGFGAPRPTKATAEYGYTWIDMKYHPVSTLIFRILLPSKGLSLPLQTIPSGGLVTDQLGEYLPVARYISLEEFDQQLIR
jgi:hypothetical protein